MNNKAWSKVLNLFFIAAAIVIGIGMFIYSTTEIYEAQGTENATAIANSTSQIIQNYPILSSISWVVILILGLIIFLWILFIFIKFFNERWVSGI